MKAMKAGKKFQPNDNKAIKLKNDFEEPPRLLGIIRRYRKYPNSASDSSKCSGMAHFSSSRLGIIQGPARTSKTERRNLYCVPHNSRPSSLSGQCPGLRSEVVELEVWDAALQLEGKYKEVVCPILQGAAYY